MQANAPPCKRDQQMQLLIGPSGKLGVKLLFAPPYPAILVPPHCKVNMSSKDPCAKGVPGSVTGHHRCKAVSCTQIEHRMPSSPKVAISLWADSQRGMWAARSWGLAKRSTRFLVVTDSEFLLDLTLRFDRGGLKVEPLSAGIPVRI